MLIATKGGLTRTGPDVWNPLGRPEYLIQEAYKSRRRLGVESIGLWQLHRIDPKVPRDEQFGAIKTRSEEHTSELQSHLNVVCRLLLEKKHSINKTNTDSYLYSSNLHTEPDNTTSH